METSSPSAAKEVCSSLRASMTWPSPISEPAPLASRYAAMLGAWAGGWLKYVFVIYANSFLLPLRGERLLRCIVKMPQHTANCQQMDVWCGVVWWGVCGSIISGRVRAAANLLAFETLRSSPACLCANSRALFFQPLAFCCIYSLILCKYRNGRIFLLIFHNNNNSN